MRTVFAVWLTLSAPCVGCADHRSSENEAKDRVGVIVDGPGSKSVPDVRVPTGNAEAKPLDLKPLIETARRHGLPMPSTERGSSLRLRRAGAVGNRSSSRDPAVYSPAYLLRRNQLAVFAFSVERSR